MHIENGQSNGEEPESSHNITGPGATRPKPVRNTWPIGWRDLECLHPPEQAFCCPFVVGDASAFEPGNEAHMLDHGELYVVATCREDAIVLAREALATRGCPEYTVSGAYYMDQLLAMAQCLHRTSIGSILPADPFNSGEPPHESFEGIKE